MDRRRFLALTGTSAVALQWGAGNPDRCLFANEQARSESPRIRVLFVGPKDQESWMSWPGAAFDPAAFQAEYSKTLASAAGELDVQLEIVPVPVLEPESIERELRYLAQSPPDGLLLIVMHIDAWPQVRSMANECAALPKIVFSPLGTSLLGRHNTVADLPGTFIAATPDHTWLSTGLRMLKTVWSIRQTRICMISDLLQGDHLAGKLGSTLHYVPLTRWTDEDAQTEVTQEVEEIAKQYGIAARDIVEPEMKDLLNAAKNYVVARRIMEAENCQGISVDCAQLVGQRRVACGMCLAWSKLLDEGCLGGCEADADAAVSLLLSMQLFNRPGFMQDPAVNTINNTLVASHCTSARKLQGYDQPPFDFSLRSHYESKMGVAVQVFWPQGQDVTIFRYQRPDTMLLGTGRVLDNVQAKSAGGCRTAIEIELDGITDPRDVQSHHQVVVCGKHDRLLKGFCQIVDLKTSSI